MQSANRKVQSYLLQCLQTRCDSLGFLQLEQVTRFGNDCLRAAIRLPLRCLECFRFGSGAI